MDGYLTGELALATVHNLRELAGVDRPEIYRNVTTDEEVPERADDGAVVSVSDLRKTYSGGVEALKGISFEVREGEIFGMLGPNGAGKTTTIGVLTTTVRPSSGSAARRGTRCCPRRARRTRSQIGVVFQESVLDNDFSGLDNLRLHARLWRAPRQESEQRIASLLDVDGATRASKGRRAHVQRRHEAPSRDSARSPRKAERPLSGRADGRAGPCRAQRYLGADPAAAPGGGRDDTSQHTLPRRSRERLRPRRDRPSR